MEEGVIPDTYDFQAESGWLGLLSKYGEEFMNSIRLEVYRCPSFDEEVNPPARKDYFGVNGGRTALGVQKWGPVFVDGVFYYESYTKLSQITDGTSHTMSVGESIHYSLLGIGPGYGNPRVGGPAAWFYGDTYGGQPLTQFTARFLRSTKRPMNSTIPVIQETLNHEIPFGSAHPGGAMFVFCDGHVDFIQDDIDMDSYQALSTRAGEETVDGL
jgi:prepilin-type processing-associated H-X9-DG protein